MNGTVFYRRLINLGGYENETIGFELPMELNESHADALARVKAIVLELAGKSEDNRKAEQRKYKLEHEGYTLRQKIYSARRELSTAVQKHDELRAILAAHGVEIAALDEWYRSRGDTETAHSENEYDPEEDDDYEAEPDEFDDE